jgi:cold shock CspA family protein
VQGVVQVYDPATGCGVVMNYPDRVPVDLVPGSLEGSVFRNLHQGQRIVFEVTEDGGRLSACRVRFGSDGH